MLSKTQNSNNYLKTQNAIYSEEHTNSVYNKLTKLITSIVLTKCTVRWYPLPDM